MSTDLRHKPLPKVPRRKHVREGPGAFATSFYPGGLTPVCQRLQLVNADLFSVNSLHSSNTFSLTLPINTDYAPCPELLQIDEQHIVRNVCQVNLNVTDAEYVISRAREADAILPSRWSTASLCRSMSD